MRSLRFFILSSMILTLLILTNHASAVLYEVTNNSSDAATANSLPWCVDQSNLSTSVDDIIYFNLGNTITIHSTLAITDRVDMRGNSNVVGAHNGLGGAPLHCFQFTGDSDGSTLSGLAIVSSNTGVLLQSDRNLVYFCRIGVNWSDVSGTYGNVTGIEDQASFNQIGIPFFPLGNVISNNSQRGIYLNGSLRSTIQYNSIGTNSYGTTVLGSQSFGVRVNAHQCLIGGDMSANEYNVISGNTSRGVNIENQQYAGNTVAGNYIGLDINGTSAIGNAYGVYLSGTSGNIIGLPVANHHNLIAGNSANNLHMNGAHANRVQNNYIGTNTSGDVFAGSPGGIDMSNSSGNQIGGKMAPTAYERNVVSGNTGNQGIDLWVTCLGNTIQGNYVGLAGDGLTAVPNSDGIRVQGTGNLIGGTSTEGGDWYGNLISGNSGDGIILQGNGNTLQANIIGLDRSRSGAAVANGLRGVFIYGVNNNLIGGANNGSQIQGNWISGNLNMGVSNYDSDNTIIAGNYIGWDGTLSSTIGNATGCIYNFNADNTLIGGPNAVFRNYIAGFFSIAINVQNNSSQVVIQNNYVDTTDTSQASGSASTSIMIVDSPQAYIDHNYLTRSLSLSGSDTWGCTITANSIGVLPNQSSATGLTTALQIDNSSNGNKIGLLTANNGNVIANCATNISVSGAATLNNALFSNTLTAMSNQGITLSTGGNGGKSAPTISMAVGSSHVTGTSGANDTIQVFISEAGGSLMGSSMSVVGSTTADGSGNWTVNTPSLPTGAYVSALATDSAYNSSEFSNEVQSVAPTLTPTPTITATITPTATPTATPTNTPIVTATPSATPSATITSTVTVTPSSTISPTPSITVTATSTSSLSGVILDGKPALAYPNPASDEMKFLVHLDQPSDVTISIYNMGGEQITQLTATLNGRGQLLTWQCNDAAPGIYVAIVNVNGTIEGKLKIAVTK